MLLASMPLKVAATIDAAMERVENTNDVTSLMKNVSRTFNETQFSINIISLYESYKDLARLEAAAHPKLPAMI